MTPTTLAALLLLAATGAWTLELGISPTPLTGSDVILVAVALWAASVTAVTGMLVRQGLWARRLALAVTVAHAVVALVPAPDPGWGGAAALSAIAAVVIGGPWLNGHIRPRPAASGPPPRVVLVPLVLLAAAFGIGISGGGDPAGAAIAYSGLGVAYWFIRALPAALVLVRVLWPLLALALAPFTGLPAGGVAAVGGVAVALLAWHPSVRTSVRPLVERGSTVRIPPELAPSDVLDAARLDDRGRPR